MDKGQGTRDKGVMRMWSRDYFKLALGTMLDWGKWMWNEGYLIRNMGRCVCDKGFGSQEARVETPW
jgi:hypothetical protein